MNILPEVKVVLQVLMLILASMAVAWVVVQIRDHIWPRATMEIPIDNQAVFERAEQIARGIENVNAQVQNMRANAEANLRRHQAKTEAAIETLTEYLDKTESK